jgi:NadR type nicotinamide-nucleotide adenylyltransferase
MDEMVVIIYDSSDTTTVPLAVRSGWIRSLYPTVQVIEAWDGPTEVGYTPELMRAHERYVIDFLGVDRVSHFYSSEPYGEHMSSALDAFDRRVDEARERVPISASEVRSDPFAYRQYVHPLVYRDLIVNVVFLGAPSTGKTTLAERLAQEFDTQWMPEYGREYWERYQVNRRLDQEQLVEIAERHIEREDSLLEKSNRYLFTDTNAITTATFARYYHGRVDSRLAALADRATARYDVVFVCDIDIPYDDTWDRSGEVNRAVFQRQVIGDLNERKVPFIMLYGNLAERISRVGRFLSRFRKYMNVIELFEGSEQ